MTVLPCVRNLPYLATGDCIPPGGEGPGVDGAGVGTIGVAGEGVGPGVGTTGGVGEDPPETTLISAQFQNSSPKTPLPCGPQTVFPTVAQPAL
mmetsp:Transcript_130747/g.231076  ORF Transcript_130747/g.231076 Transcript_130747/m.231076 type:complete len:93 (+) Transcript_130747:913-1191(+)